MSHDDQPIVKPPGPPPVKEDPPKPPRPKKPKEKGKYDHIDFGFFTGSPQEAKTAVEQAQAQHLGLGLSRDHLIQIFAGGDDAGFEREMGDKDRYPGFIAERHRIKEILRQHRVGEVEYVEKEMPKDCQSPRPTNQESFKKAFHMTTKEAFEGEWPFNPDYNQPQRHELAKWCADASGKQPNTPNACLLLGPTQRGKTYAIRFAAAQLIKAGASVDYIEISKLCAHYQYWQLQRTEADKKSAYEVVAEMMMADMLFIDDLGTEWENFTDKIGRWLYEILENRNQNRRPTCISSNLTEGAIRDRFDERVTGRIRTGGTKIIQYGADCLDYETWKRKEK